MEFFSEVYGCYYHVIARLLEKAKNGLSKESIESFVNENAFYDSAFHILPKLFSGEWDLIENNQGKFFAKLKAVDTKRPLTTLERAWLKAILMDKRIHLFLLKEEKEKLEKELGEVTPLFYEDDFHVFDTAADGDHYEDPQYIGNFRKILWALEEKAFIAVDYESGWAQTQRRMPQDTQSGGKPRSQTRHVFPYKLNYSSRDDKFRLLAVSVGDGERCKKITFNLSRIATIEISDKVLPKPLCLDKIFGAVNTNEPIIMEISRERNALERCMLQFASWEKQTEYDEEKDNFICRIFYDKQDETELLIRILSFGPVVKVLSPESFLMEMKKRIMKQFELNH